MALNKFWFTGETGKMPAFLTMPEARDEFGQICVVAERLLPELLARKIIWFDGAEYRIKAADYARFSSHMIDLHVCDFCQMRPVEWTALCDTFNHPDGTSVGDWQACDPCGRYIKAGDRRGLIERFINKAIERAILKGRFPPLRATARLRLELEAEILPVFNGFWLHYKTIQKVNR